MEHELIKKTLIIVGLVMIWVTSTNYFAVQFINIAGYLMSWLPAISFKANHSADYSKNALPPQSELVSSKEKEVKKAITPDDLSKGNSTSPQAIVILGGWRRRGALETHPEY